MNKKLSHFRSNRAFTLFELSISTGLLLIVGGLIYSVLNGGMILYSKNIATNYSNLSVRSSSLRLIQDIHESVGLVEVVGSNLLPTSSPKTGVRFPVLLNNTATRIISDNSGSFTINKVSPTSSVSLRIPPQTVAPRVGDIVVFPDTNDDSGNILSRKITAVTVANPTVLTMKDLGVNIIINNDAVPDPTIIYITRLAAYAIVTTATDSNGLPEKTELRYYPDASNVNSYTVTERNLTTFLPFLSSGDYVAPYGSGLVPIPDPFTVDTSNNTVTVNLMTINTETGKRKFVGDRMLLSQTIPTKCLILQSTNYN